MEFLEQNFIFLSYSLNFWAFATVSKAETVEEVIQK